jgi:hypothetical protein
MKTRVVVFYSLTCFSSLHQRYAARGLFHTTAFKNVKAVFLIFSLPNQPTGTLLSRLVTLGTRIKLLLLDRGFYSVREKSRSSWPGQKGL